MNTSFLAKVDPLNNEAAYVGVVALSLVLSVFVGMSLIWPGDELAAQLHPAPPGAGSKADTTVGREEAAHGAPDSHKPQSQPVAAALDPTASSHMVVEAKAVTMRPFVDKRP
ncbi:MAG: hypothetical protein ACREXN_07975 [Polaromonas sp.]